MANKGVILQAQIEGVRTRKDHTYSITIGTQELAPEIGARLFSMNNSLSNVYISPNAIQSDLLKEIDLASTDIIDLQKTPSKRMKAVLYLLWKQNPEGYDDANLYYQNKMEAMLTHLKSKLE